MVKNKLGILFCLGPRLLYANIWCCFIKLGPRKRRKKSQGDVQHDIAFTVCIRNRPPERDISVIFLHAMGSQIRQAIVAAVIKNASYQNRAVPYLFGRSSSKLCKHASNDLLCQIFEMFNDLVFFFEKFSR